MKGANGRVLIGRSMDTHNSFDKPNTIHPAPFSGRAAGGNVAFELPAKSVAVVQIQ